MQCDKHLEETFLKGVRTVCLETATWTVTDSERTSPEGDPIAVPKALPCVCIHLQAGLYRAKAGKGKAGDKAGDAEKSEDSGIDGKGGRGGRGSSLLPWSKRTAWGIAPRIHGTKASSFHS